MSDLSEQEKERMRQTKDYEATKPILRAFLTTITKFLPKISAAFLR